MRPEEAEEVRDWLQRAADDLREAEHDLTAAPPLVRGAVFHSQQAAERALKAFLAAHDRPFSKTHDLDELGRGVVALDPTLTTVVDRAKDLTPYAWRFRYPGAPLAPTEDETREARAREVYIAILALLPDEARP